MPDAPTPIEKIDPIILASWDNFIEMRITESQAEVKYRVKTRLSIPRAPPNNRKSKVMPSEPWLETGHHSEPRIGNITKKEEDDTAKTE